MSDQMRQFRQWHNTPDTIIIRTAHFQEEH